MEASKSTNLKHEQIAQIPPQLQKLLETCRFEKRSPETLKAAGKTTKYKLLDGLPPLAYKVTANSVYYGYI